VAIHHRDSAGLAAQVLAGLPGTGHAIVQADLIDASAAQRMVADARELLGGLDVLVNNAGVLTPHPVTEVSYWRWRSMASLSPPSRPASSRPIWPAST
jgi:3-oxoacyl-[acyl-carrier protein] reductase